MISADRSRPVAVPWRVMALLLAALVLVAIAISIGLRL
jgi:hypothetical protein